MILVALVGVLGLSQLSKCSGDVFEGELPLNHSSVIREQAAAKQVPAELIAAVIYAETGFNPRRSPAGAEGLMQLLPSTGEFIARNSGGIAYRHDDLGDPEINIRYGTWLLRWLLQRYSGNRSEAVAAYNAGFGNVDKWKAAAAAEGRGFELDDIRFPETRAYTEKVLAAAGRYRTTYPRELGLAMTNDTGDPAN